MSNRCRQCQEFFEPEKRHPHQKFCCERCRNTFDAEQERKRLKLWFETEWQAWNRDFAAGKTQSNFKEESACAR